MSGFVEPGTFRLEPGLTFLNHGSFGACPRIVLQAQSRLRLRMERNPVRFLGRDLPQLLEEARREVAAFMGARPGRLVFVRNATSGVNAVLRSLRFRRGDELLLTDHAYPACLNAAAHATRRAGARLRLARIPFPIASPDEALEAILSAVTPRTRLALIEHVTSPTALVLPIGEIIRELAARGIETLVDGAHAPGMLDLRLEELGAAYYTGNLHKWCCAPKGSAFLWIRDDLQAGIHPAVISLGYGDPEQPLHKAFDWTGTDDPTPWLAAPLAIRWLGGQVPGGWPALRAQCRDMVLEGVRLLTRTLGQAPPAPTEMIGCMAALRLPDKSGPATPRSEWDPLQARLYSAYRIEVPVIPWPAPPMRWLRVSGMVYNRPADYGLLADALNAELNTG